jgi:molybdate transport system ATP-binding protein
VIAGSARFVVLDARVVVTLGSFALDAPLEVADGETVAVLGPNGAGKTTLLRALAGLAPLDDGWVRLDGDTLDEPSTGRYVVPERRPAAVVFQDYLLFPHLDARENVAFGLRARGMHRRRARAVADTWLDRVGVDSRGARPAQLSGGQAQRVALARALAVDPRLLLLDEPLAALDASTRRAVRRDLRRHLASFPGARVLVTHDLLDAVALADRIVVLERGHVVQAGAIAEVSARPRSRYVADLVGVNLLRGTAHGHDIELAGGETLTVADAASGDVYAVVHPHAVALHRARPEGSPRNVWAGRVDGLDLLGDRVRIRVAAAVPIVAEVTPAAVGALGLAEGVDVWASVKATEVSVYPA